MKLLFLKILSSVIALVLTLLAEQVIAQAVSPEVPLAKASDIEFSVEYSAGTLMLGDILYAKSTIRNKTKAAVRIEKTNYLYVEMKTPVATEESCRGRCGEPGGGLLELAPGQSIVCYQVLDAFGNDGYEDGSFNPFDETLQNQEVKLLAARATLPDDIREKIGTREHWLEHEHKIKFGLALIEKEAFDRAVAAELARDDLEPLKIFPFGLNAINSQHSYLMRRGFHYRDYNNTRLSIVACLRVLSQALPAHSTLRRAASLTLASERLAIASPDEEAKAISDIIALLSKASPIERAFLKGSILADFQASRAGTYRVPNVPKEKFDRFVQRLKEAGI